MRKFMSPALIIFLLMIFCTTQIQSQTNLNGLWKGSDSATYYIRHIPKASVKVSGGKFELGKEEIWWFGQGKNFGNVFHGSIEDGQIDKITGKWVDVPVGQANNNGSITIVIAGPDRLVLIGEPGNFAVREWKRIKISLKPSDFVKPSNN